MKRRPTIDRDALAILALLAIALIAGGIVAPR
jgi:hypothetical protein